MVGSEWSETFLGGLGDDVGKSFGPCDGEAAVAPPDTGLGKQVDKRRRQVVGEAQAESPRIQEQRGAIQALGKAALPWR